MNMRVERNICDYFSMNCIALFPLFIGCLGRSASIDKFGIKGEDLCLVSNELHRVISLFIDCSLSEKKRSK